MVGGYERVSQHAERLTGQSERDSHSTQVHAHDEEDSFENRSHQLVPNSPPPSFHSRASSPHRRHQVDPTLADAFDDDDDNSEDEADDRQRLVRQSTLSSNSNDVSSTEYPTPTTSSYPASSARSGRIMGGGNGTDGVFANMSARPERQDSEKDEQPPVGPLVMS